MSQEIPDVDPLPGLRLSTSGIDGLGVFTEVRIPAGAPVIECRGSLVSMSAVVEGTYWMQVGPDLCLVSDPDCPTLDDYINHSCEPNVGFSAGDLTLYALRDIEAGSELLFDYSTSMNEPSWTVPCSCGARNCRLFITSFCDLAPPDRQRLEPIALAYLRTAKLNGGSGNGNGAAPHHDAGGQE
jgi:uncharacterized protein